MSNTQVSSHRKLTIVLVVVGVVVILAFVSAFVWPGWAFNRNADQSKSVVAAAKTPSIPSKPLPSSATALLKAMPDNVLDFARVDASASANWSSASPLEEYTLKYANGESDAEVSLTVAQWPERDAAKKQYEVLLSSMQGNDVVSGKLQVGDKTTGSYVVRIAEGDTKRANVLWQNDTAVFQLTGNRHAVERFYRNFPL